MKRLAILIATIILTATLQADDIADLFRPRPGVTKRISSYDTTGANLDLMPFKPGETRNIAQIQGSGIIRHIWTTINSDDPNYLRNMVIRFFWDGEKSPSIEMPIGDLFGQGHGVLADIDSQPLTVVRVAHYLDPTGRGAMNLFFPMPFSTEAKIEIENQGKQTQSVYFYIDYDSMPLPEGSNLRFHAVWKRQQFELPDGIISKPGIIPEAKDYAVNKNTTGKDNYVVLDAIGRGHYVGCVLSVDSRGSDIGKWWEGDDMIFIDDDTWPPSIHGTGTEDYFSLAWGFRILSSRLYHGTFMVQKRPLDNRFFDGRFSAYRFHVADPIVFKKKIRVTFEHGHANDAGVRFDSTAYWYQTEPHVPHASLPPVDARTWKD